MTQPRRPLGRPPLDPQDKSVAVTVRMPSRQYGAVYERAQRERINVPELIRRLVSRDDDDE